MFSGTKKPALTNHAPTVQRLLIRKRTMASAGQAASCSALHGGATDRDAAPQQHQGRRARRRHSGDGPRFVSREAGCCQHRAGGVRPFRLPACEPHDPVKCQRGRGRREQQRLGHRRALKVEHVRIETRSATAAVAPLRDPVVRRISDASAQAATAGAHDRDRDRRRRRSGRARPSAPGACSSRCGSGSQTAPTCCQPGVRLSMIRRATTRWARAS